MPRSFGPERIVCVCNATYCDSTPDNDPKVPEEGSFYWYASTKQGLRMDMIKGKHGSCQKSFPGTVLTIDSTKQYQTIYGFGGAFTDAVGINLDKLSPATRDQVIRWSNSETSISSNRTRYYCLRKDSLLHGVTEMFGQTRRRYVGLTKKRKKIVCTGIFNCIEQCWPIISN